ncbi:hypothetical protein FS749_007178, partial [Ceratobasidium sp. UAMH 11750]
MSASAPMSGVGASSASFNQIRYTDRPVPQSRLRQKQLRAAEQPGEPDISITRVEESIEGVAHLHSDKPFSRNTEKRLELRTVEGTMDVDVVVDGRERLVLEAIGERRQANVNLKI